MALLDLDPRNPEPRRPGIGRILLVVVLAAGAAGAGYWLGRRDPAPRSGPAQPPAAPAPAQPPATPAAQASGAAMARPPAAAAPLPPDAAAAQPSGAPPASAPPAPPPTTGTPPALPSAAPPPSAPAPSGPRRIAATLSGPLEDAVVAAAGPGNGALGAEITQVVNRLLVWSLQVSKDARRGDRIEILWSPAPPGGSGPTASQEPVVEAVRFTSQKLGRTVAAYRFRPAGAPWPRYYRADGSEVEERLVDGPIDDYEQVTSLVKDGRRHKGVDFRTPVGTPVRAPFDGTIERRNWKFAANGNCLDVVDPATGRHAIFLHLDVVPKEMQKGRRVRKGEVIARSGNSGHSTAPHLHYQLEDASGKVLDPFKVHRTTRNALPASDRAAFDAERARIDGLLSAP